MPRAMASAKKRPSWYQPHRWEVLSGPCSRWNRVLPGLNSETLTTCRMARASLDCSLTESVSGGAKMGSNFVYTSTGAWSCGLAMPSFFDQLCKSLRL